MSDEKVADATETVTSTETQTEQVEQTQEVQSETTEQTEQPTKTVPVTEPEKKVLTLTQDELDHIVQKRLARERRYSQPAQPQQTQQTQTPPSEEPRPDPNGGQFKTYEEFMQATAKWEARQEFKRLQQESQVREQQQQFIRARDSFNQRANETRAKYEDFDDVAFDNSVSVTPIMSQALMESEQGPEILYYLGNNPREAARISQLSPTAQIREIGKIEAKIQTAPKPAPKTSAAQKPIQPVNSAKPQISNTPEDSQDTKTWMAKREAELKARRKR